MINLLLIQITQINPFPKKINTLSTGLEDAKTTCNSEKGTTFSKAIKKMSDLATAKLDLLTYNKVE